MLRHSHIHRHTHVTRQYSLTIYILSTHYIHTYTRAVTVMSDDVLGMDSGCVDGYLVSTCFHSGALMYTINTHLLHPHSTLMHPRPPMQVNPTRYRASPGQIQNGGGLMAHERRIIFDKQLFQSPIDQHTSQTSMN